MLVWSTWLVLLLVWLSPAVGLVAIPVRTANSLLNGSLWRISNPANPQLFLLSGALSPLTVCIDTTKLGL